MLSNITSMTTLRYGPYNWIENMYSKSWQSWKSWYGFQSAQGNFTISINRKLYSQKFLSKFIYLDKNELLWNFFWKRGLFEEVLSNILIHPLKIVPKGLSNIVF